MFGKFINVSHNIDFSWRLDLPNQMQNLMIAPIVFRIIFLVPRTEISDTQFVEVTSNTSTLLCNILPAGTTHLVDA